MRLDYFSQILGRRQPILLDRCALVKVAALLIAAISVVAPRSASAQATWEYTPYQVNVCIALDDEAEFTYAFAAHVREVLAARADMAFFASWKLAASSADSAVAGLMQTHWDKLNYDDIKAGNAALVQGDKTYLVAVTRDRSEYLVRGRELDVRTRIIGPTVERRCGTLPEVPLTCWDAVVSSFVPIARLETVGDKVITARVRAAGLITDPGSPALIQPGDAMRVVIRRNDKSGEPVKNGIQPLAWTVLSVQSRNNSLLDCAIASGYRTPIPQRANARMDRLALVARPILPTTRLILQSRGKDPHPLTGYEVYVKGIDDKPTELLGVTDWRGAIEIPRGDVLIRTLYIKNGNQLLARLPLVPGDLREAVATTLEDDFRLRIEGYVMALQGRVTDLVARREILAARIRKRIGEGKFDAAELLVTEYSQLESRDDLIRELDKVQGEVGDNDAVLEPVTKARIGRMLGSARELLLNKYLDPATKNVLAKEVENARSGNPAPPATAGS